MEEAIYGLLLAMAAIWIALKLLGLWEHDSVLRISLLIGGAVGLAINLAVKLSNGEVDAMAVISALLIPLLVIALLTPK